MSTTSAQSWFYRRVTALAPEGTRHAPSTQRQDRRHARTGDLLAREDQRAFPRRGRCFPAQFQPRPERGPPRAAGDDPRAREGDRATHRHPRGHAGPEAAPRHLRRRAGAACRRQAFPPRSRQAAGRWRARAAAAPGDLRRARAGHGAPAQRRQCAPQGRILRRAIRGDRAFALDMGVDWVALSFVQRPEDVAEARKLVAGRAGIMVKLEKPAAIRRLAEIVELSDALMVARGDLGVEMPPEDVPPVQKQIVHACRVAGKPVIVATQMLESMIHAPVPTRAEASDVATAIYDGADAVMLSAETAAGEYPIEAVTIMDRIIRRVQADPLYDANLHANALVQTEHTASDAISVAARQVADTIGAAAIVSYTTSGATALRAARERPKAPILALTSNLQTARRLALVWGLHCVHTRDISNFSDMVHRATRITHREGFADRGQRIVVTAGVPFGTPGATNVLRIAWVEN